MNIVRLLLVYSIFLTSCASTDPYPSDWNPITQRSIKNCGAIEGVFQNFLQGELSFINVVFYYDDDFASLRKNQGPYVRFTLLTSGDLEIAMLNSNKEVVVARTLYGEKGDFSCEDGYFVIDSSSRFLVENIVSVYERYTSTLYPTDDYLVVKRKIFQAGEAFFIPSMGSEAHWYRYKRLSQ